MCLVGRIAFHATLLDGSLETSYRPVSEIGIRNGKGFMEQRATATLVPDKHEQLHTAKTGRQKSAWKERAALVSLIISDVFLALLIWLGAYVLQSIWGRGALSEVTVATVVPSVAVWIGLRSLLGLYPGYGLDAVEKLRRHIYSVIATLAILAIFAVASQIGDLLSRLLLMSAFMGLLVLPPLGQNFTRWALYKTNLWGRPVVILSYKDAGDRVVELLDEEWSLGYIPTAIFDYRLMSWEELPAGNLYYEETLASAVELARDQGVDTAIFAMPHTRREQLAELVGRASIAFRHVLIIPNLSGITNSAVVARNLAGTFAVEIKYNLLDPWALRAKRAFDLVATTVGGILVFPLILILALFVYLESGGPVFYKDYRMGRDGKLFSCLKFRTMVPNAEVLLQRMFEEGAELREEYIRYHKLRNDPRVTRVGRFLRKTSLDELPQLWNVLRGEMSLVGPRPYLPRESEEIGMTQNEILRVPPGITGPWQVSGRNHASFEERVEMDAYYVRDWSVWLDLVLLARTVRTVLFERSAY